MSNFIFFYVRQDDNITKSLKITKNASILLYKKLISVLHDKFRFLSKQLKCPETMAVWILLMYRFVTT